ncbi:hypothetical protein CDCA_CDCA09G2734 [Cyanidium caldarium]|uniref:3-oxo-5-alpha-steroid 4-dehydrogenase C-terminal domain-containing protein n=1 Tax=Cyanidium caldarium TaxID=2771 RepID=A0AAV9IWP9_CYACA|nr:hypothetical protein CDCA_CDCA09G2734 [Cyanidium caldarium]
MEFYDWLLYAWIGSGLLVFPVLLLVSAPYGRHLRTGWGPTLPSNWGWVIQESPSFFIMAGYGAQWLRRRTWKGVQDVRSAEWMTLLLAGCWLVHYANRAFVFPLRMRGGSKPTTWVVVSTAILFCVYNTYLNAYALFVREEVVRSGRGVDASLVMGVAMWAVGWAVNYHSDDITRQLRRARDRSAKAGTHYAIPYGGMFRYISAPNYFGEWVEWCGFALAARTRTAWSFALWTFCNLYPRARTNHQWYLATFPEYAKLHRNAFFPDPSRRLASRQPRPRTRRAATSGRRR